jgi:hypothetical protein
MNKKKASRFLLIGSSMNGYDLWRSHLYAPFKQVNPAELANARFTLSAMSPNA